MTINLTMPRTAAAAVKRLVAERFVREPEHEGADSIGWAQELRQMRLSETSQPERQQLALAAAPYREVLDEHLGVVRIASLEPARLFDALTSAVAR
ncbi:hypothetical protein M3G91_23865 [Micromonospora chalcea]|uniref:hypothetical protein n=1 Tax=Micromonospora chalcea TaxID=1874 RepID=UPI0021A2B94A|nr:hypothetical protein [Micromonospora chalcea]MCT2280657.1 hypothetical protein [Micromonospora chalcea]